MTWKTWWFVPSAPHPLAICRILFCGALLGIAGATDYGVWAEVDASLWRPIWTVRMLHLAQPTSAELLRLLQWGWIAGLALSCVGLWTRASLWLAWACGTVLLTIPQNFGKIGHAGMIAIWILLILALSRCGDAWSLDARRRRRSAAPSGEYTWPIRMVWVVMAVIFCSSGIAKLRHSGWAWAFSDNLSILLFEHAAYHQPLTLWGVWIGRQKLLCVVLAFGSLLGELLYPWALWSPRARAVIVPAVFSMQVGIALVMGPMFTTFMFANAFWVPWEPVLAWAQKLRGRTRPLSVGH